MHKIPWDFSQERLKNESLGQLEMWDETTVLSEAHIGHVTKHGGKKKISLRTLLQLYAWFHIINASIYKVTEAKASYFFPCFPPILSVILLCCSDYDLQGMQWWVTDV